MVPRYNNALELIEHSFAAYADKTAFTCLGQEMTYKQIDDLSERFARYLRNDLGLAPGDRIAIQLPNLMQFPVAFYGAVRAGLIVVNTNPLYTPREIRHQLCDSGAKVLVVLANIAHNAAEIIEDTDIETVIVTNIADLMPFPKRQIINGVVKYIKRMVPSYSFSKGTTKQVTFDAAIASTGKPFSKPPLNPETVLILQYTGGTTGVSKGAMLSHKNMVDNVWQLVCHIPLAFTEGSEILIACLPLYHIYALNLHLLSGFAVGEHNVLIPNPRDLKSMVKEISRYKFTVFVGINTLFTALCRFQAFKKLDFSALKVTAAGGMALTEDAADAWENITQCGICEGYGLTETSPVVCGNLSQNIVRGTVGPPVQETELKLIDDEGNTVTEGAGELCVRGPQVMLGYWNNEAETKLVINDEGWLKTGDVAEIRKTGEVAIVDRKKDLILVSGFNVYPNEVEETVCQMPGVVEAAAIGVTDARCGEVVKLFIVVENEHITEDQIKKYCHKNLTAYKRPKFIEFRGDLPKSNVGKILRKELR